MLQLQVCFYLLHASISYDNYCLGFGEIMGTLARIGYFSTEPHPLLKDVKRPTFRTFLLELLATDGDDMDGALVEEKDITKRILRLGYCKDQGTALKTAKTIM